MDINPEMQPIKRDSNKISSFLNKLIILNSMENNFLIYGHIEKEFYLIIKLEILNPISKHIMQEVCNYLTDA